MEENIESLANELIIITKIENDEQLTIEEQNFYFMNLINKLTQFNDNIDMSRLKYSLLKFKSSLMLLTKKDELSSLTKNDIGIIRLKEASKLALELCNTECKMIRNLRKQIQIVRPNPTKETLKLILEQSELLGSYEENRVLYNHTLREYMQAKKISELDIYTDEVIENLEIEGKIKNYSIKHN